MTYDLYGQTPLGRALMKPIDLDEKIEEIYKEQIMSASYMIKKIFKKELT